MSLVIKAHVSVCESMVSLSCNMKITPIDMADYLDSEELRAAYLKLALESGNAERIERAKETIERSRL